MRAIALMMRLAVVTTGVVAGPGMLAAGPGDHPLVGKWRWTHASNNCTETYDFRADGTVPIVSGAERTENAFTITSVADAAELFRVTIRTTKDFGGKDCADDEADSTGVESTSFLLFDPERTRYLACDDDALRRCFGPLQRVDL